MPDVLQRSRSTDVPVALFLFNRPSHTARIYSIIKAVRPSRLFIVADGPRSNNPTDAALCAESRAIVEQIDWSCTVERDYADRNLGCRQRIKSGLDWLFNRVEEAIILEDDTLPDPTFFQFCAELLDRYRNTPEIMSIGGSLLIDDISSASGSYWFSRYPQIWGWATWRRAWARYDLSMKDWPSLRDSGWPESVLGRHWIAQQFSSAFDAAYDGFDTWDYAWTFASLRHGGLTALPNRNLIMNIGFGIEGTHGGIGNSAFANRPTSAMVFPLIHPERIKQDQEADASFEVALKGEARKWAFQRLRDTIAARDNVDILGKPHPYRDSPGA